MPYDPKQDKVGSRKLAWTVEEMMRLYELRLSQRVLDGWASVLEEDASVLEGDDRERSSDHDEGDGTIADMDHERSFGSGDEDAGVAGLDMDQVWGMLGEAGGTLRIGDLTAFWSGLQLGLELGVFRAEDGFLTLVLER